MFLVLIGIEIPLTGTPFAPGWPLQAYVLIGRDDIAATVQASLAAPVDPPQSSLPLASPVSSLALATPLHHGAGGGASPKRPSLGRTPIRQPQLGTLPGGSPPTPPLPPAACFAGWLERLPCPLPLRLPQTV